MTCKGAGHARTADGLTCKGEFLTRKGSPPRCKGCGLARMAPGLTCKESSSTCTEAWTRRKESRLTTAGLWSAAVPCRFGVRETCAGKAPEDWRSPKSGR